MTSVLIYGRAHEQPPDPGRPCNCVGGDPDCDDCLGLGRIYPERDYEADSTILVNGERLRLAPSLKIANHSPTGFSWGYSGSGPAQLALAILLHLRGEEEARRWYQKFKAAALAPLCMGEPFEILFDFEAWTYSVQEGFDPPEGIVFLGGKATAKGES